MFEIGNSLREARLRRQVDFPAAELATKIRAKYLRALEDEQFDQLPAQTYVKGFLRAYADYLGLDGQLYVDEYNSRYASGEEVMERGVRRVRTRAPKRSRRLETSVVTLVVVAIGAVTSLVFVAWHFGSGGAEPVSVQPRAQKPAVQTGLLVKAVRGNTWLVVRTGSETGPQAWQGTLLKGKAQRFTPPVWVNIGTPENVLLRLNGRDIPVGGNKPRSLIITPGDVRPAGPGT